MIKPTDVTPEVSQALAHLRAWDHTPEVREALDVLDNAGVFAEIDEANDYASAEEIFAESAAMTLDRELGKLDPAEWGDVSRTDIARRSASFMAPPKERPNASRVGCKSCGLRVADGSEYHASCRPLN